jgi:type III secretion system (T3SS) inner membrane Yop/YscD-like protein
MTSPELEIIVLQGDTEIVRRTLASGEYVIGRHPDCDIVVDAAGVSRHHAKLVVGDGYAFVEDLGSTNGTLIDGSRITESMHLAPGRKAEVGATTIEVCEVAAADAEAPAEAQQSVPLDEPDPAAVEAPDAAAVEAPDEVSMEASHPLPVESSHPAPIPHSVPVPHLAPTPHPAPALHPAPHPLGAPALRRPPPQRPAARAPGSAAPPGARARRAAPVTAIVVVSIAVLALSGWMFYRAGAFRFMGLGPPESARKETNEPIQFPSLPSTPAPVVTIGVDDKESANPAAPEKPAETDAAAPRTEPAMPDNATAMPRPAATPTPEPEPKPAPPDAAK